MVGSNPSTQGEKHPRSNTPPGKADSSQNSSLVKDNSRQSGSPEHKKHKKQGHTQPEHNSSSRERSSSPTSSEQHPRSDLSDSSKDKDEARSLGRSSDSRNKTPGFDNSKPQNSKEKHFLKLLQQHQESSQHFARSLWPPRCIEDFQFKQMGNNNSNNNNKLGSFESLTGRKTPVEYLYLHEIVAALAKCSDASDEKKGDGQRGHSKEQQKEDRKGENYEWKTNGLTMSILEYCFPSALGWTKGFEQVGPGGTPDFYVMFTGPTEEKVIERIEFVLGENKRLGTAPQVAYKQTKKHQEHTLSDKGVGGEVVAQSRYSFTFVGTKLKIFGVEEKASGTNAKEERKVNVRRPCIADCDVAREPEDVVKELRKIALFIYRDARKTYGLGKSTK